MKGFTNLSAMEIDPTASMNDMVDTCTSSIPVFPAGEESELRREVD